MRNLKSMLIWALRRGQVKTFIRQTSDVRSRLEKFNEIWIDAIRNVPFYGEWARQHGLPQQIGDLKELCDWPVLEKKDLILNRDKLVRLDVKHFHESVTGGATGEPLHFRTMAGEDYAVVVNKWTGWARLGIYPDSQMFLLWGHRHFYGQGWRSDIRFKIRQFKDWMTNHKRMDATVLTASYLRKVYKSMLSFSPECIVAYSASLLALVRAVREEIADKTATSGRFQDLRAVICTAGPLSKGERKEIASFFGVPVSMEYGSMEAGVMAYQTPSTDSHYKVFEDTHVLHADEECGTGRHQILVTCIYKRYLPLIRYRIGDYMEEPELCKDGSVSTFSEVTGRSGDIVDFGNGIRFHGYSLMVCAEANPKIIAYQLNVEQASKSIVFVAQTISPLTSDERGLIIERAAHISGLPKSTISIEESNDLEKAPSGKIKLVIYK